MAGGDINGPAAAPWDYPFLDHRSCADWGVAADRLNSAGTEMLDGQRAGVSHNQTHKHVASHRRQEGF